jgi:rhodanese-related sulfurtransferase
VGDDDMMNRKNRTGGIDNMRKVFVLVLVSLIVLLTMPLIFTNVALANATDAGYINITADAAKQMIDENQSIVILDVRTLAEYKSGHIDGSKLMPLLELEERINAIDGNSAVIVYCGSGVKSEKASKILLDHGFDKVYNMKGGLNAWQDVGFPVVSGSTANQIFPSNDSLSSEIDDILSSGKPVFLFLYVDWCHFCQQQIPIIDELEQEYNGKITFFRVNCEDHPKAMKEFEASGYPSMFLMDKGDDEQYESQYFGGFTDKETLKESIYRIIANGGINKNSMSLPLRLIGASPTPLLDDEKYTGRIFPKASGIPTQTPMGRGNYSVAMDQSTWSDGQIRLKSNMHISDAGTSSGRKCEPSFGTAIDQRCNAFNWEYVCPDLLSGCVEDDEGRSCVWEWKPTGCSSGGLASGLCMGKVRVSVCPADEKQCNLLENAVLIDHFCTEESGFPRCVYKVTTKAKCNDYDEWVCTATGTTSRREYRDWYCVYDVPGIYIYCEYPTPTQIETKEDGWVCCTGNTREFEDWECQSGQFIRKVTKSEECPADYWGCVDSNTRGLYHCICVSGSLYLGTTTTEDCSEGKVCKADEEGKNAVCEEEVPEFPAGITAVFGTSMLMFFMMRKKYVRK